MVHCTDNVASKRTSDEAGGGRDEDVRIFLVRDQNGRLEMSVSVQFGDNIREVRLRCRGRVQRNIVNILNCNFTH